MKLKTFTKVNTSTNTRYVVFNGEQFVEDFTINYLSELNKVNDAICKRFKYESMGADVQHVDVYKGQLEITIQIGGATK